MSSTTTTAQAGSSASSVIGPAPPRSNDNESASFDAVHLAHAGRPFLISRLGDRCVPQLSSKRPGLDADGITWDNPARLPEHLRLRLRIFP
jgi:hypothetical protein